MGRKKQGVVSVVALLVLFFSGNNMAEGKNGSKWGGWYQSEKLPSQMLMRLSTEAKAHHQKAFEYWGVHQYTIRICLPQIPHHYCEFLGQRRLSQIEGENGGIANTFVYHIEKPFELKIFPEVGIPENISELEAFCAQYNRTYEISAAGPILISFRRDDLGEVEETPVGKRRVTSRHFLDNESENWPEDQQGGLKISEKMVQVSRQEADCSLPKIKQPRPPRR